MAGHRYSSCRQVELPPIGDSTLKGTQPLIAIANAASGHGARNFGHWRINRIGEVASARSHVRQENPTSPHGDVPMLSLRVYSGLLGCLTELCTRGPRVSFPCQLASDCARPVPGLPDTAMAL